tara:strand:+ start:1108 stop:1359 length:252 start_codon:yes stop_codon:yes gene_type:complete
MNKKYITVNNFKGNSYSKVAEIMSKNGHKMNHSSVRNYVTNGFCKIVKNISKEYNLRYTEEEIKKIAQSQEFQDSIVKIMKKG